MQFITWIYSVYLSFENGTNNKKQLFSWQILSTYVFFFLNTDIKPLSLFSASPYQYRHSLEIAEI